MKDFVTADPYLTSTDVTTVGACPVLILACDGVWDVLTDQEAGDLILDRYNEIGPNDDAARLLVRRQFEIDREMQISPHPTE